MKLDTIEDRYILYHINDIQKFDLVKGDVEKVVKLTDTHKVMGNLNLVDYLHQLRENIRQKYKKFFFIVAFDSKEVKIVALMPCFIVTDHTDENKCLIYGAFFYPTLMKILLQGMLHHIEAWAKEFNCVSDYFSTTRKAAPYERLLKPYGFFLQSSIFERKIDYGN